MQLIYIRYVFGAQSLSAIFPDYIMAVTLNGAGKSSINYLDTGNTEALFFFTQIAKYHTNIQTKKIFI